MVGRRSGGGRGLRRRRLPPRRPRRRPRPRPHPRRRRRRRRRAPPALRRRRLARLARQVRSVIT